MALSRRVLDFLQPGELPPGLKTLEEVRAAWPEGFPEYTLLPRDVFDALLAEATLGGAPLNHDWVQAGVWRGGGALFLRALMDDLGVRGGLHLYDSFSRIPVSGLAHANDQAFVASAGLDQAQAPTPASEEAVRSLLSRFSLDHDVDIWAGDVRFCSVDRVPRNIGFLHLDLDFYEATHAALTLFYPRLVSGGVIVFDDYYTEFLDCRQAVDDYLSAADPAAARALRQFSSYSALLVKP